LQVTTLLKIVSFSGIDGAGKSTQIAALEEWLRAAGLRTQLLTFWDDVVVLPRFREFSSRHAFGGDKGFGTPEHPINRRDKNVDSWIVTAPRLFLYLLDAVNLRLKISRIKKSDAEVVIFDRYIYDELANLPANQKLSRAFMRFVLKLSPKPDAAYIIDADPALARARKPEYPLEFLHRNRQAYLTLAAIAGNLIVTDPSSIAETEEKIRETMRAKMFLEELKPEATPIFG
jgi:thymidylate kinase